MTQSFVCLGEGTLPPQTLLWAAATARMGRLARCGVVEGAAAAGGEGWQTPPPRTKASPPGLPQTRFSFPTASSRSLLRRVAAAWKQTDLRAPQLPAEAASSGCPG